MTYLRKFLPLFTALALAIASPIAVFAQSSDASGAADLGRYGISCSGDECTIKVNLPDQGLDEYRPLLHSASFALNVLQQNIRLLPDGAGFSVTDALNLTFPLGGYSLFNADLTVELNDDGVLQRMVGSAVAPALGIVGVSPRHAPVVNFGYDQGSSLPVTDAPTQPDHNYLYLQIGSPPADDSLLQKGPANTFATVVADMDGSSLYLDGAATVRAGSLALMQALLPLNSGVESLMDWALAPQQTGVRVSVVWTGDPADSQMRVQAVYGIDGGLLTRWLPFDFAPIALDSIALIDGSGLHLTASTQSSIAPTVLGEGALQASLFIPFNGGHDPSFLIAAAADAPLLGLHLAGDVELGDDFVRAAEAIAAVNRFARDELLAPSYELAVATAARTGEAALDSYTATADAVSRAAAAIGDGSSRGFYWVANASGDAATLVVDASGRIIASIVDGSGKVLSRVIEASGAAASTVVDASGQALAATVDATTSAAGWAADASGAAASTVVDASGQALAATVDATTNVYSVTVTAPGRMTASIAESNLMRCHVIATVQSWCAGLGWCAPASAKCDQQEVAELEKED